jgi:hypothetical protein
VQTPNLFEADLEAMRAIDGTSPPFPPLNWLANKPVDPATGDVWVEPDTGRVFVWNNDCWMELIVATKPGSTS